MAQLVFFRGYSAPLFRIQLQNATTKIGRAPHCDVVLDDPEISREHAAFYKVEGQILLKKIGKGRVFINGQELQAQPIFEGDKIEFGNWRLQLELEQTSKALSETQWIQVPSEHTQSQTLESGIQEPRHLSIEIYRPSTAPRKIPLSSQGIKIGSHGSNDIVLQDPYVSGRHLRIEARGHQVWVWDLGSTNGTYLKGIRIREALWDFNTEIKIGESRLFLREGEDVPLSVGSQVSRSEFYGMVGTGTKMRSLFQLLKQVAPSEAPLLIFGESGVGKELVAQAAHQLSPRKNGNFVALNCGAISPELIESELFGHEKGAFTGAHRQHEGAFGQAAGGTLFLDEIGELPLELQPKLLRVLENKTYRRVGGSVELQTQVRVLVATHRDLGARVAAKQFREDLFFRLFVLPVVVPPLRERMEDIQLLSEFFLQEFAGNGNRKSLNAAALAKLQTHPYPGNIRELKNVLLRAHVLSQGAEIAAGDILFPQEISPQTAEGSFSGSFNLEAMEKQLILKALKSNRWNKARTAEVLGIAKSTLFAKIKLYDLKVLEEGEVDGV